jgi:protein-S-isoprenylcysteine O-methyltransferase Ste14
MRMNWGSINADQALQWANWLWDSLLVVWLVMWFGMKRAKKLETPWEMAQHAVPVIVGFWLLFEKDWKGLNIRLVPETPSVWWFGLILTATGVALSIWARLTLGANWSGVVTLKKGHELIRKGLYRSIRHPIYTGIITGCIGTATIKGNLAAGLDSWSWERRFTSRPGARRLSCAKSLGKDLKNTPGTQECFFRSGYKMQLMPRPPGVTLE